MTRYRNSGKAMQYDFYRTKQWHDLRQQALDRDHYVCCYCGKPNSNTVDHVVPIEYDKQLMTSIDNLATTCRECHHLKTQWEQSYYGTGAGNTIKNMPEIRNTKAIKNIIERMAAE